MQQSNSRNGNTCLSIQQYRVCEEHTEMNLVKCLEEKIKKKLIAEKNAFCAKWAIRMLVVFGLVFSILFVVVESNTLITFFSHHALNGEISFLTYCCHRCGNDIYLSLCLSWLATERKSACYFRHIHHIELSVVCFCFTYLMCEILVVSRLIGFIDCSWECVQFHTFNIFNSSRTKFTANHSWKCITS